MRNKQKLMPDPRLWSDRLTRELWEYPPVTGGQAPPMFAASIGGYGMPIPQGLVLLLAEMVARLDALEGDQ